MDRLDNKSAIITGAGGNIGGVTAKTFAREGARVLVADIDIEGARSTVADIEASGGTALAFEVDLADEASIKRMVDTAVAEFGGVDILHNNAAATKQSRVDDRDVLGTDMAVWRNQFRINVRAPLVTSRYVLPIMIDAGGGVIINTGSGRGATGALLQSAYLASKAALINLTKAIATQYGRSGIRANLVIPGFTESPDPNRQGAAKNASELLKRSLIGRLGQPQDIANAALFLASDEASYITGQLLSVEGGSSVHSGLVFEDSSR